MANFGVYLSVKNSMTRPMYVDLSRSSLDSCSWGSGSPPTPIKAGQSATIYMNDDEASIGARGTATYFIVEPEETKYYSFYGSCPVGSSSNGCTGPGLGSWNDSGHPLNASFEITTSTVPSAIEPNT